MSRPSNLQPGGGYVPQRDRPHDRPPAFETSLARNMSDALRELDRLDELYMAAMLMRWDAEWGLPCAIHSLRDYSRLVIDHSMKVTLTSTLRGLGSKVGDGATVRITVSDVREQVDLRIALVRLVDPTIF